MHFVFDRISRDDLRLLATRLADTDADAWIAAAEAVIPDDAPDGSDHTAFHWELEFPEVFAEHGGFDVVLGNPPYVSAWEMTRTAEGMRDGLKKLGRWKPVAKRHWDLFVLFVALSKQLLVPGGTFGIIVANPLMRERYAAAIREELLQGTIRSIVDFEDTNVFDNVARETVVIVWDNQPAPEDHEVLLHDPTKLVAYAVA